MNEAGYKEYLLKLTREYTETEISARALPDLESVNGLCADMLACRERVENVRIGKLARTDHTGRIKIPGYFHSVFGPEKG